MNIILHTKILTAASLALLLAVGTLSACSDGAAAATDKETAETEASAVTEAITGETALFSDAVTRTDFGGAAFRILTANELNGAMLPTTQNYAETETGEVVNDTLFQRDRWMEETFNVAMEYTLMDSGNINVLNSVQAGDDVWDLILADLGVTAPQLSTAGALYPLNLIKELELQQDYWFPKINNRLYLGRSLYYCCSAISPRYWGSVYLLMFNRDLARDLDMEDLYQTVADGKWTIDKMEALGKQAMADLNGDGIYTSEDRYGILMDSLTCLLTGGEQLILQNDDGKLRIRLGDRDMVDYMQRVADLYQKDYTIRAGYDENKNLDWGTLLDNGNFLFSNPVSFSLASYRDKAYDYGILPMPKRSEEQDGYYAYSQPWANACPMFPVTLTGDALSRSGVLTDAMAAYGYDYIKPAVFENVIQLKGTRDEQSAQIVDMIFENVVPALNSILKIDNVYSTVKAYFGNDLGKQDIVSAYTAVQKSAEAALDAYIAKYEEIYDELEVTVY